MINLNGKKILIGPSSFADKNLAPLETLEKSGFQVLDNPYKRKLTREELTDLLSPDVAGIIAGLEILDRSVLENSHLKVISRCGAGMSNVDIEAAKELGMLVYNTPNGPTQAVAELTVGCLLALLRQIPQMNRAGHEGKWDKRIGRQLKGMTILVVGFGRIGQAVAKLLNAFNTRILVCDPGYEKGDISYPLVNLDDALPQADVIAIHASGEACILGEREFSLMKQGSFILNAARGNLVVEEPLMRALDTGCVAGAWIDTFNQEPYEGALMKYEQVLLTPHVGSYTSEGRLQMELDAVANLIQGFQEIGKAQ
jgi:D-3-phosphoglycerate dehydrogenase / 2-oxoglutarate reductase